MKPETEKKPLLRDGGMGSPERWAWLATLDHQCCKLDPEGRCMDIHCTQCGEALGGGWGPCTRGCSPR